MMSSLEQAIAKQNDLASYWKREASEQYAAEHKQLAAWLRELQERRKAPEIVTCGECKHYKPMSSDWGNCYVHGSPTELHRTCQSCDYCSWSERRTE